MEWGHVDPQGVVGMGDGILLATVHPRTNVVVTG